MKELICTCCKGTATVENENTLPYGWCVVNIPNKECADLIGIVCENCKLKLLQLLIDHGAYPVAYDFGNSSIIDSSKPIICRYENKML